MDGSPTILPEWKKGHSRLNPTVAALIARGVDSETAAELRRKGWTLGKIQQQPREVLQSLGIRSDAIERILDSDRPPIPFDTLVRLLVANRMTCCVCQSPDRGVIVHHLADWVQSHSHDEQNLAVLCLIDHDRAHSKMAHTQNLTVELIRQFKESWQRRVRELSTHAILSAAAKDFDCWWYFNRIRLFAMAEDKSIALTRVNQFRTALLNGWINSEGHPLQRNHDSNYSLRGGDGGAMYAYLKAIFDETISSASVLNISDDLDRNFLKAVLRPGHLIFLQGSFRFVEKSSCLIGPGQTVEMYRRANDVCVTSTIDRWEATSNSAWSSYLKGIYEVSAVMRVVAVQHLDGGLKIQGSSIAIGAPLEGMKTREYSNAPYRRGYYTWDEFGEEDDDDENSN